MTLNAPKRDLRIYYSMAFALPFLGYLIIALLSWAAPFSSTKGFLISDSYYQYYPFFHAFRRALLSGESLLYSWDVGMGMDYMGLISYYLASPLNLLLVLVPGSWTLEFYFMLVPIRLGLASLFFAIFLQKVFRKTDASIALFGALYGTCAWALGYLWNVMWLDSFALLPLVALGTLSLLQEKKFALYTVSLFLAIFSNYYIGFFVCIFVLLLFIGYQITNFTTFRRFFADLGRIAGFSVLAIGMSAAMSLPAMAALSKTKAMADSTVGGKTQSFLSIRPQEFRLNISTWDRYSGANGAYSALKDAWKAGQYGEAWHSFRVMTQYIWKGLSEGFVKVMGNMGGGLTPTSYSGLPNLYCGVGTMFMGSLFVTLKGVKKREKFCCVSMLVFLILSFLLRQLDYIWHGFHFPNQLPYRFSFIFSFVMLYMAYRAYLQRFKIHPWQIGFACVCTCLLFYCSDSRADKTFLVYNGAFFLLYVGVFCVGLLQRRAPENADKEAQRKFLKDGIRQRQVVSVCLWVILMVEFVMNLANFAKGYSPYDLKYFKYPSIEKDQVAIVSAMKDREDELFYRADVTHSQIYNEGALLGFHSTSTFTSSADVDTTNFMKALGLGAQDTWNRYCYETASPVTNLFLNIKYLIHRSTPEFGPNAYFDQVATSGTVELLENNAYLPLGFLAEPQLANTQIVFTSSTNRFGLQNQLMRDAAGINGDVWRSQPGSLMANTYTIHVQWDGLLALDLKRMDNVTGFSIYHNDILMRRDTPDKLSQMISVCDVKIGDTVTIQLTCNQGTSPNVSIEARVLDEALFRQAYNRLNTSTLHITKFETDYIKGYIDCHKNGILYTSIPDDGNWKAYVDGKQTDIVVIGDAMVGVPISQGHHRVEFRYENSAFSLGWKVSLLCTLILLTLIYLSRKKPFGKGKYEKALMPGKHRDPHAPKHP